MLFRSCIEECLKILEETDTLDDAVFLNLFYAANEIKVGIDNEITIKKLREHKFSNDENKSKIFKLVNNNARLLFEKNDFVTAEKYLKILVDNKYIAAVNNLGILYAKQGKFEEAEKYWKMAVENNNVNAMNNLGILYYKEGKFEEAEKYYKMAVKNNDVNAMFNLGLLYEKHGKLEEAEKFYKMAVENNNVKSMNNLGNLYYNQGKFEEAEKFYKIAVENNDVQSMNNLAALFHRQKNYETAEIFFQQLLNHKDCNIFCKMSYLNFLVDTSSIEKSRQFLLSIEKELLQKDESNSLSEFLKVIITNNIWSEKFKKVLEGIQRENSEFFNLLAPAYIAVMDYHKTADKEVILKLSTERQMLAKILLSFLGYRDFENLGAENPDLLFGKLSS